MSENIDKLNITVVGTGYVGMSMISLLSKNSKITAYDIDSNRLKLIKNAKSPVEEEDIEKRLKKYLSQITCTDIPKEAFTNKDFIILCVPTNYDEQTKSFDTSILESIISEINNYGQQNTIIIKSTIPIGYTDLVQKKFPNQEIIFSPEFLREGKSLFDNLFPSRIVIGSSSLKAKRFVNLLKKSAEKENIPCVLTNSTEAETIKLFSNTFLALRIGYFNEIDSFCEVKKLDSKQVIEGICHDSRIGNDYNNPSFGYGGYCLPKDTKQALKNFNGINQSLIGATVKTNILRKEHIVNEIRKKIEKKSIIGIYRLVMKSGSDNFRESAIFDIMNELSNSHKIIVYEPNINNLEGKYEFEKSLENFKDIADLIIANRMHEEINDVANKVYTRDIFGEN